MKTFDENDLIAYYMQELSPARERALRTAMESDAALTAEFDALGEMLRDFRHTALQSSTDDKEFEQSWQKLRPSLTPLRQTPWLHGKEWMMAAASGLALAGGAALIVFTVQNRTLQRLPGDGVGAGTGMRTSPDSSGLSAKPYNATRPLRRYNNRPGPLTSEPANPRLTYALLGAGKELDENPPGTSHELLSEEPSATQTLYPVVWRPQIEPPPAAASAKSKKSPKRWPVRETDVAVSAFGDFTAGRSSNYATGTSTKTAYDSRSQTVSPSAGILGTFHRQFSSSLGYDVTTGVTRNTFNYIYAGGNAVGSFLQDGSIQTDIFELTSAYVAQGPRKNRLSTFVKAGGGVLVFLPSPSLEQDSYVYRGTGVIGVGAQYSLGPHFGIRMEYRGLMFKGPDFRNTNGSIPVSSRFTLSSEPQVGLVYRFGRQKE